MAKEPIFWNDVILPSSSIESITKVLQSIYPHLKNEPLLFIMQNKRFCIPVLYALHRMLKTTFTSGRIFASRFSKFFFEHKNNDDGFLIMILNKLEHDIDWIAFNDVTECFTFDTLLYCGINADDCKLENVDYNCIVRTRMQFWINCMPTIAEKEDIIQFIQWIVKKCFPIVKTTKNRLFVWDPFVQIWCLVNENLENVLLKIFQFLWLNMKKSIFDCFDWLPIVKNMVLKDMFLKIDDVHQIRQMKHCKLLKELSIIDCANVPELYLLQEGKLMCIEHL